MSTESRFSGLRLRTALGATLAASVLVAAVGVGATASGASTVKYAAPSAFCKTLLSAPKIKYPSVSNVKSYRSWTKQYVPFFQKLASTAPTSASKKQLSGLVTVLQGGYKSGNSLALGLYWAKNSKQWLNGWSAFTSALMTCATSMY